MRRERREEMSQGKTHTHNMQHTHNTHSQPEREREDLKEEVVDVKKKVEKAYQKRIGKIFFSCLT
jgi:hypothetical protein